MSVIRQNFHSESEALLNKQINMELYASYVYLSMVLIEPFFVYCYYNLTFLTFMGMIQATHLHNV